MQKPKGKTIVVSKSTKNAALNKMVINTLKDVETFKDLYEKTENLENKEKGDLFEIITYNLYKLSPLLNKNVENIWLYKDIPKDVLTNLKLPEKDKGIDLLVMINGQYYAIQCKFRQNPNTMVKWGDLGTFFGMAFGMNDKIYKGILVTNTYDLCTEVIKSEKVDPIYGDFFENLPVNFFKNICNDLTKKKIELPPLKTPFPHQVECINKCIEHYGKFNVEIIEEQKEELDQNESEYHDDEDDEDNENIESENEESFENFGEEQDDNYQDELQEEEIDRTRGHIVMAPGSGKTLNSYWIDKDLGSNKTVIFVPSLYLLSQFYSDWINQSYAENVDINYLLVGSDADIDEETQYISNGLNLYTDPTEIRKILDSYKSKYVIICTYQSADKLAEACGKEIELNFGIFDEAHKTVGQVNKKFSQMLTDDKLKIKKRLFMTATPKIYNGAAEDDEVVSMDDEEYYGREIFCYNTGNAINDKRLVDYQLVTIIATNADIKESINKNKLVSYKNEFDEEESNYLAAILMMLKKINDGTCNHLITYHNTVRRAVKFKDFLIKINDLLYKDEKIYIETLDGNTSMSKRKKIVRDFENSGKAILTSARVLNEGVNIPIVDSVCFVDSRVSTIDIVQCMGRAFRLHKDKKMAYVFVPIFISDINDEFDSKSYGNIIKILKAMKSTDESVSEYFVMKSEGKTFGRKIIAYERFNQIKKDLEIDMDKWNKNIENRIWKLIDPNIESITKWKKNLDEVKKYINDNNKRPSSTAKNIMIKNLGIWIINQSKNYLNNKHNMKNSEIKNIWNGFINNDKYKKFFTSNEDQWMNALIEVKKYMDINNKRPNSNNNNKHVGKMAKWLGTQINCYNRKKFLMSQQEIRQKWELFVNDDKYKNFFLTNVEKWEIEIEKCKKYIENKKSGEIDINPDDKKLVIWMNRQACNYKNGVDLMKNQKIKNLWERFINDNKYKIYFISAEEEWIEQLQKIKIYIDKNNKRPSSEDNNEEIKKMGIWLLNQTQNYKNNFLAKKNSEINKLWEEFINDDKYKKYFLTKKDQWIETLNNIKQFIDINKRRPNSKPKNKNGDERSLGNWLSDQLKYKKNSRKYHILDNDEIKKIWDEFIVKNADYILDYQQIWYKKFDQIKNYINENKRKPSSDDKNNDIAVLGRWIITQQCNYDKKLRTMKNEKIREEWEIFLEEHKEYFKSDEELWNENLDKVKIYIDDNNKRPSSTDKNNDIKYLGVWLVNQLKNYKKKSQIMKNENISQLWEQFINDDMYNKYFLKNEEIWENYLNKIKEFVNKKKIKPSSYDKNKEIGKLGVWLNTQIRNYEKKIYIMKNNDIRKKWEEFINDDEYKIYM